MTWDNCAFINSYQIPDHYIIYGENNARLVTKYGKTILQRPIQFDCDASTFINYRIAKELIMFSGCLYGVVNNEIYTFDGFKVSLFLVCDDEEDLTLCVANNQLLVAGKKKLYRIIDRKLVEVSLDFGIDDYDSVLVHSFGGAAVAVVRVEERIHFQPCDASEGSDSNDSNPSTESCQAVYVFDISAEAAGLLYSSVGADLRLCAGGLMIFDFETTSAIVTVDMSSNTIKIVHDVMTGYPNFDNMAFEVVGGLFMFSWGWMGSLVQDYSQIMIQQEQTRQLEIVQKHMSSLEKIDPYQLTTKFKRSKFQFDDSSRDIFGLTADKLEQHQDQMYGNYVKVRLVYELFE